jgi:hypothetical protein
MRGTQAALLLLLLSGAANAGHVLMRDCSGRHLRGAEDVVLGGPSVAAALTAALAGLIPPQPLDRHAAQQVRRCAGEWGLRSAYVHAPAHAFAAASQALPACAVAAVARMGAWSDHAPAAAARRSARSSCRACLSGRAPS